MSLANDLANTLRAVRSLKAQRQDDLEDYFHDAIAKTLEKGRPLEEWLAYLYKSVYHRVACGQEGRIYLPLEEGVLQEERPVNIDAQVDVRAALAQLTSTQQEYLYAYFYKGHTLEEIAAQYHVTRQSVERVIQRGLDTMKRILSDITS